MSTRRTKQRNGVVRRDPPTRAPDGTQPWGRLKDADPDRHYVVVDPGNQFHGVEFYESLGYVQEVRQEGGVRFVMNGKGDSGSVLTQLHQVLMSISKAEKAALDAPGQAEADAMERRIIQKKGGVDGLRGLAGYFEIHGETSRNFVERGA